MIKVNIPKAKTITHDLRRAARSAEFEPYDNIIAKQLPGMSVQQAEAVRQAIREKYAQIQVSIDNAVSEEELLSIINSLKSP